MSNEKKEDEMICALTADEHVSLQQGLRALPDTMPPRQVWARIREQAEAEGLFTDPQAQSRNGWYLGAGVAAAALLAAVLMLGSVPETDPASVVPQNIPSDLVAPSKLRALQVQSQQLESDLRALPEQPSVGRASTVATMSEIEDRIAAIDYQLNDATAEWVEGDREIFWRERVRLMNLLLQLRYAQAQRAAY
jgi:hypothetical protein